MTSKQINEAIAEHCGWIRRDHDCWVHPQHGYMRGDDLGCCPNYAEDLNAMHEAENTLDDFQHDRMRNQLWLLMIKKTERRETSRRVHSAEAHERAEAFLRTIGKWKENE